VLLSTINNMSTNFFSAPPKLLTGNTSVSCVLSLKKTQHGTHSWLSKCCLTFNEQLSQIQQRPSKKLKDNVTVTDKNFILSADTC
jgi:hypothetical protein